MNGWTTASGSSSRFGIDPRALGIDDRDAREHVRLVDAIAQRCRGGGKLDPRVHTLCLHRILSLVHGNPLAILDEDRNRVGQVELSLRVVRRQPVEHWPQAICAEDVDRRVDLAHSALLVRRVTMLDDRGEPACR